MQQSVMFMHWVLMASLHLGTYYVILDKPLFAKSYTSTSEFFEYLNYWNHVLYNAYIHWHTSSSHRWQSPALNLASFRLNAYHRFERVDDWSLATL